MHITAGAEQKPRNIEMAEDRGDMSAVCPPRPLSSTSAPSANRTLTASASPFEAARMIEDAELRFSFSVSTIGHS